MMMASFGAKLHKCVCRRRHHSPTVVTVSLLSWSCVFLLLSVGSVLIPSASGFLLWDWKFLRKALQLPPLPPSSDSGARNYRQISSSRMSPLSSSVGNETAENENGNKVRYLNFVIDNIVIHLTENFSLP